MCHTCRSLVAALCRKDSAESLSALILRMCDANDFYVSLKDAVQMIERLVVAGHTDTAVRYLGMSCVPYAMVCLVRTYCRLQSG
jgi:hypothetical protein